MQKEGLSFFPKQQKNVYHIRCTPWNGAKHPSSQPLEHWWVRSILPSLLAAAAFEMSGDRQIPIASENDPGKASKKNGGMQRIGHIKEIQRTHFWISCCLLSLLYRTVFQTFSEGHEKTVSIHGPRQVLSCLASNSLKPASQSSQRPSLRVSKFRVKCCRLNRYTFPLSQTSKSSFPAMILDS